MPLMNGEDFLKAKNSDAILAAIPVVAVSARIGGSNIPGLNDFIQKPFNMDELLQIVRRYCPGEAVHP
jgi:CheY-like chemotaxis protein